MHLVFSKVKECVCVCVWYFWVFRWMKKHGGNGMNVWTLPRVFCEERVIGLSKSGMQGMCEYFINHSVKANILGHWVHDIKFTEVCVFAEWRNADKKQGWEKDYYARNVGLYLSWGIG